MTELLTIDNLLVWIMISILIFFIWAHVLDYVCIVNKKVALFTILCAILALPITILILVVSLFVYIIKE
jgi:hypothetical protein